MHIMEKNQLNYNYKEEISLLKSVNDCKQQNEKQNCRVGGRTDRQTDKRSVRLSPEIRNGNVDRDIQTVPHILLSLRIVVMQVLIFSSNL